MRKESIEHVLLYGPPGLGKTTLATIVANEMNVNVKTTSGPAIERAGDLAAILTNLEEGDILFIDEIHRLNRVVEEVLYPAMEDFELDIVIGKGPSARSIRLDISKFTLIGATTRVGLLSAPLRDRFGIIERLEYYTPEELKIIILRAASILETEIKDDAALEVAKRSRGTPRIANRLLKRVRDWVQVKGDPAITLDNIQDFIHESPRPAGWDEFTLSGMDLDKMLKIREDYLKRWPDTKLEDINSVLGENRAGLWITWCAPKDKVISARTLPGGSDYGFSSGPLSNVLASHFDNPNEVYLVGHDLYSETGENVNNIYKGTNCYIEAGCSEVPPANWINHHKLIFDKFPQISYYKVNPKPISSNDRISRVIEEWKNTPNLEYITQDEMYDRLH